MPDDDSPERDPHSTITVPPGSNPVELPEVPRAARLPDILSPEQQALFEADPTAPRWALHLCARFERVKADLPKADRIDNLINGVRDLVDGLNLFAEKMGKQLAAQDERLDRHRNDLEASEAMTRSAHTRIDDLSRVMHGFPKRFHDLDVITESHDKRIAELEKKLGTKDGEGDGSATA